MVSDIYMIYDRIYISNIFTISCIYWISDIFGGSHSAGDDLSKRQARPPLPFTPQKNPCNTWD